MEGTIAQLLLFGGNFAPVSWAICSGQILPIAQNTALFSILGTTYGGNGQSTFGLPNFSGRTAIGVGQGPGLPNVVLGEQAGSETVTLQVNQMPAHTHSATPSVKVSTAPPSTDEPGGAFLTANDSPLYGAVGAANGTLGAATGTVLGTSGNNQPFSIRQPYLGVTVLICLSGVFPARN